MNFPGIGLNSVSLRNGYQVESTPYGDAVAIQDISSLFQRIAVTIALSPWRYDGNVLRFQRKRLQLSQKDLGTALGYSDGQMIAQWEKGVVEVPPSVMLAVNVRILQHFAETTMVMDLRTQLTESLPNLLEFSYEGDDWRWHAPEQASWLKALLRPPQEPSLAIMASGLHNREMSHD